MISYEHSKNPLNLVDDTVPAHVCQLDMLDTRLEDDWIDKYKGILTTYLIQKESLSISYIVSKILYYSYTMILYTRLLFPFSYKMLEYLQTSRRKSTIRVQTDSNIYQVLPSSEYRKILKDVICHFWVQSVSSSRILTCLKIGYLCLS
jgi:hypothetical protein